MAHPRLRVAPGNRHVHPASIDALAGADLHREAVVPGELRLDPFEQPASVPQGAVELAAGRVRGRGEPLLQARGDLGREVVAHIVDADAALKAAPVDERSRQQEN